MSANLDKWRYTLITTLIFLIIVHPYTYKLTQTLLGSFLGQIASPAGCPTTVGLLLHAVVFTLILRYIMDLKL